MTLRNVFRRARPPAWMRALMPHACWEGMPRALYLTFDDGPHPDSTPALLGLLKRMQWQATFFILGRQAERYPDLFRQIRAARHGIGNHGYEHLHGWWTASSRYLENWRRGYAVTRSTLFRPPYGKLRPRQYRAIRSAHHRIVMWRVMPYDFARHPIAPQAWIPTLTGGDIIVLHDSPRGLRYFRQMLPLLREQINRHGWEVTSLPS